MEYKFPRNTPKFVRQFLIETLSAVHSILRGNLIGIYLYGSLAMGCYNSRSSDIDVILVAREKLAEEQRKKIVGYLKKVGSKDRRLELSIIDADVVRNPQYPIIVDLHYEYWGNIFQNEKDSEILSNLYTTRKRGFCVWGPPTISVFSKIPAQYHLRSVREDLDHTRRYLHENPEDVGYNVPMYWVLSSCRVLAFIREKRILSKLEGGRWGLTNLPEKYHNLIEQALSCYQGKEKENSTWNNKELDAFADYMSSVISGESNLKTETHVTP